MPAPPDQPGDFVLESDTHLMVDSSTLAGLGPRSLAPRARSTADSRHPQQ